MEAFLYPDGISFGGRAKSNYSKKKIYYYV